MVPAKAVPPPPPRDLVTEFPGIAAFGSQRTEYRQNMLTRQANLDGNVQRALWAIGPPAKAAAPGWANSARGPGISSKAGFPTQGGTHFEFPSQIQYFGVQQAANRTFHDDLARARRQGAARELATQMRNTNPAAGINRPTRTEA